MQGDGEVDEAEEAQGSKDEDGAVVQQQNRPLDEAGVMQRSSHQGNNKEAEIRTRPRRGTATVGGIRPW